MENVVAYIIIAFGVFGFFKFVSNVFNKGYQLLNKRTAGSLSQAGISEMHLPNDHVGTHTADVNSIQDEYEVEYQEKCRVMGAALAHDFVNLRKWEDEMVADYRSFLSKDENIVAKMFDDLIKTLGLIRGLIERSDGENLFLDDLFNHLLPLLDKLFNNYIFFSQQDPHLISGVTGGISKAQEGIEDAMSLLRKKAQCLVDKEVVDMTKDISSLECSHVDRLARKYEGN